MREKKKSFHYRLDELIERLENGHEVNFYPALLGLAYQIREDQEEFYEYIDSERGYDP